MYKMSDIEGLYHILRTILGYNSPDKKKRMPNMWLMLYNI
jgi:hypothetical protein